MDLRHRQATLPASELAAGTLRFRNTAASTPCLSERRFCARNLLPLPLPACFLRKRGRASGSSAQPGFSPRISFSFFSLRHLLSSFSRVSAVATWEYSSKQQDVEVVARGKSFQFITRGADSSRKGGARNDKPLTAWPAYTVLSQRACAQEQKEKTPKATNGASHAQRRRRTEQSAVGEAHKLTCVLLAGMCTLDTSP